MRERGELKKGLKSNSLGMRWKSGIYLRGDRKGYNWNRYNTPHSRRFNGLFREE